MSKSNDSFVSSYQLPLIALVSFLFLGLIGALLQGKPPQAPQPAAPVAVAENMERRVETFVFFYTQVFQDPQGAKVVIPYRYENTVPYLWIGYTPENETSREVYLVSHPQLNTLSWEYVANDHIRIYQKVKQFDSVEAFVGNPPSGAQIVIEPELKDNYPQINGTDLTETIDLEAADYIVTTFVPSKSQDGAWMYEHTLPLHNPQINDKNQMEWFVRAPAANEENPYFLGTIHVDYIQEL